MEKKKRKERGTKYQIAKIEEKIKYQIVEIKLNDYSKKILYIG